MAAKTGIDDANVLPVGFLSHAGADLLGLELDAAFGSESFLQHVRQKDAAHQIEMDEKEIAHQKEKYELAHAHQKEMDEHRKKMDYVTRQKEMTDLKLQLLMMTAGVLIGLVCIFTCWRANRRR